MTRADLLFRPPYLAVLLLLLLLTWFPCKGFSAELFPGYPQDIRTKAISLVEAARPGNEEAAEQKTRALRKAMIDYSIVSMNEVPDRIFERAQEEGWKEDAVGVMRPLTRIAPLSTALWAWLFKEDLSAFRIRHLFRDIEGFCKTFHWYSLALAGCLTWFFLCVTAAVSWFAVWVSASLLLRAQPALTADLARIFKKLPFPGLFAFAIFMVCFLAPVLSGAGLGVVAIIWLALSAGYLHRWEIAAAILSIFLLAAVYIYSGAFHSAIKYAKETRKEGWFGGEGYFPLEWPSMETGKTGVTRHSSRFEEMVLFTRARAEMQTNNNKSAELLWTEWISNALDPSPGYNNRGIVRRRLGKIPEALKDFEKAMETGPPSGPAYWNSYQIYLESFRLEDAAKVQEAAWNSLRKMSHFDYRAEEMTRGELLPSPFLVNDIWKELFVPRPEWFRNDEEDFVFRFLFRPLSKVLVLPLIVIGCFWMMLRRSSSPKAWQRGACRSCGVCVLMGEDVNATGICKQFQSRMGEVVTQEVRLHAIAMHRCYVKACSVVVPGAGAFWAGKTVSLLVYGILLSLLLGILTVSMGAGNAPSPLVSAIMKRITPGILAILLFWWVSGIVWSWRSFDSWRSNKTGGN